MVNLSVLYSHTVQSMMTHSFSHLFCIDQFKTIRQHWYDTLNHVTKTVLVSQQEMIDIQHIDLIVSNVLHAKPLKIKEIIQNLQSIQLLKKILYKILLVCLL
ncbi:unnamed protein product [Rhizopus stolonifer]